MNEELVYRIEKLERELAEMKRNRFYGLTSQEKESLKSSLFERTAATLASGASLSRYIIITVDGVRRAIPTYNKFTTSL